MSSEVSASAQDRGEVSGTVENEGSPLARFTPDDASFYLNDPDPDEVYQWLHEHAPVYWYEPQRIWVVSKWADVRDVARDAETFCSSRGMVFFPVDDRQKGRWGNEDLADERALAQNLLTMDPPDHVVYRRLFSQALTPRLVARLEPRIREIADECLKDVQAGDVVDLVEQLSVPLPLFVIAELLGVPTSERDLFKRCTDEMTDATPEGAAAGASALMEMFAYFENAIAERSREPRDDLLSALAMAEEDGRRLGASEILTSCALFLAAGNETTRNLLSGGVRALSEFPGEKAKLIADPSLIPRGIEEMLRWLSVVRYLGRVATKETEIHGQVIAEDDAVIMYFTAANRDAEIYADPNRFDVTRDLSERPHVAFGWGEHGCLGSQLARLEAKVVFEVLLDRFPGIELAGPPEFGSHCTLNTTTHLPVTL